MALMEVNTNPGSVAVWWTPSCGYLHLETDPLMVSSVCDYRADDEPPTIEGDNDTHDPEEDA